MSEKLKGKLSAEYDAGSGYWLHLEGKRLDGLLRSLEDGEVEVYAEFTVVTKVQDLEGETTQ